MDNYKKKNIILAITVIVFGLSISGGTFALLTTAINTTNGNYVSSTECFDIEYNINNQDGTQDITGTLLPSSNPSGGLLGRVGLKVNDSCNVNGIGTLKLHVDSNSNQNLMRTLTSYCIDKSTLEPNNENETTCKTNGNRWMNYGDSYCENPKALVRMTEYSNQTNCESNGGSWTSGGSPLKYAVYASTDTTALPLSVGHINSSDIGTDKTIFDGFTVTHTEEFYYIYVWLDGNMTDNTFTNLSFSGNINATVTQRAKETYTVTFDANGGTVPISSKKVILGESYGPLPTPTRPGYKFLGWNGKNKAIFSPAILSEDRIQNGITWHATSENTVHISGTANGYSYLTRGLPAGDSDLRKLSAGTYTLSSNLQRQNSDHVYIYGFYDGDTSSTTYVRGIYNNGSKTFTLTENSDTNIQMQIATGTVIDQDVWVQLEKGTIATEWEPYYITSDTTVVQENNHTLTAIWEPNS